MAEFAAPLRARLRRFRRDEGGSLLVLGMVFLSIFVLLSGIAIDVMRAENRRVALSQALDRCTLNAASLGQTIDPKIVVHDCVERDGMLPFLTDVSVSGSGSSRAVEATGSMTLETLFMHSAGIDRLKVAARARAEQSAGNIEIVMVLDVSGSMNTDGRINGLRTAARNFVNTVLTNNPNRASIAVVPYNGQVNLGPALASKYTVTSRSGLGVTHNGDMAAANCIDLPASVFGYPGLSRALPLPASGWFDGIQGDTSPNVTSDSSIMRPAGGAVMCRPSSVNVVRLPDNNRAALSAYLNRLVAEGSTSINLGLKWGSTLLDPQARSIMNEFVAAGTVPAAFRDRPFDYNRPNTQKIIVLMTDGQNEIDVRLNDPYRTGLSPIFIGSDGLLSIRITGPRPRHAGANQFWVPQRDPDGRRSNGIQGEWRARPWGGSPSTTGRQLRWQEVWQITTTSWVAWQLYARALGSTDAQREAIAAQWRDAFRSRRGSASSAPGQDAELRQICDVTKRQGVLIYSIAFDAPPRGIAATRNCASSDAHFFLSTNNRALDVAFQAIATNITQLRLTN